MELKTGRKVHRITIRKVQQHISGDKLTKQDLDHARRGVREQRLLDGEVLPLCHLRSGARVCIMKKGARFVYVVHGYAQDGSDLPK